MFLPVMRGTLSLPAIREPDVLERLQQTHLVNMCSRLQLHFNTCALHVSSEQQQITNNIKEVSNLMFCIPFLFAFLSNCKCFSYLLHIFSGRPRDIERVSTVSTEAEVVYVVR